jgi:hypothetical protein
MNTIKRAIKFIKICLFSFNQKERFLYKLTYYLLLNKLCYHLVLFFFKFTSCKNFLEYNQNPKKFLDSFYSTDKDLEKKIVDWKKKNLKNLENKKKYISPLIKNGFIPFTEQINLNKKIINNFQKDLIKINGYNSQVPMSSSLVKMKVNNLSNYFSLSPNEPKLFKYYKFILTNEKLKKTLKDYFGFKPKLYSINTMITNKCIIKHPVTELHRDYDDKNFLALFVYWTSVSKNDGATIFLPGSHLGKKNKKQIYLSGEQGSAYLADTFALHAGNKAIKKTRVVTWFRFGERSNLVHFVDKGYLFNNLYDELF